MSVIDVDASPFTREAKIRRSLNCGMPIFCWTANDCLSSSYIASKDGPDWMGGSDVTEI